MALTQVDQGLLSSTAQYTGFKNRIINGAMGIWQRGTSLTGTGVASAQYLADRWGAGALTSAFAMSRDTSVPTGYGFPYSLKLQRTAGQTSTAQANVIQVIESVNMLDLAGQSVTLSFWAKCGANFSMASSAFGVIIESGTVADQGLYNSQGAWTGATYPVNTTQVLTTSWQKFTFTASIPSNSLELCVYFYMVGSGTAGADDAFYITGVQLEKGSTATSFDYRPYGTELNLCQRYYQTTGSWFVYTGALPMSFTYRATMRTTPTIAGGGAGFSTVASTPEGTFVYQSSAAAQTLTFSAEL